MTRTVFGGGDPAAIDAAAGANVDKEQLTAALSKLEASQVALKDWIASGGDAELESALGGLQAPDVAPPGVPVGEFGAPGARGYKPGEVAAPGPPSQAPLENAAEGTPVTRMLRRGAPSIEDIGAASASGPSADIPSLSDIRPAGETPATAVGRRTPAAPTTPFDFKDSGLTFDPETRQYTTAAEQGAGKPDDLMAALQGTHDQLASGKSMREVLGLPTAGGEPGFEPPRVDPSSEGFTPLRGNGEFHAMGDDEFEAYQKAYKQRLTPDERADAQSYAGGGRFRELNGGARQGVVHASNVESAARLDELIAKSPLERPMQVARVIGMEGGEGEARKLWESLKPGDVVTDGGWQSTTANFEYAHGLGDTILIADVPRGYPAAPLPGPHNEWEMVLRRDTSYRVKSIREADGKLYAHVEVVPAEGSPPSLKVLQRGESAPKGPPVKVTRAAEAVAPADDLLSQLQGTAAKLGEGKSIGEIGASSPARAEYVSKKLAKREADASYFRAKAKGAAPDDGGDLLSALQGTNEGLGAGKSMRELSGAPMVSEQVGVHAPSLEDIKPVAPKVKSPSDTTRLREMIGGLGGGSDLPVSAAEYSARREAMGFASATAKKNIGRAADNDAIEALLQKRTGKNVDMAPALERAAKVIGDHEAASAEVADLLGADAPKTAVEKSKALAAARQAHAEAQGASAAKTAQGINDRGISGLGDAPASWRDFQASKMAEYMKSEGGHAGAMRRLSEEWRAQQAQHAATDQTVVEPGIRERMDALRGRGDKTVVDPTIGAALREQGPVGAAAAAEAKGGIGGKLADVGTALEVMKALGVHVPALSAIPVIGPVLGLFLKARAVLGILGRKGGSVGRDVDGLIAAAAAATRDRIAKATQAILTGAGKGALKISEAAAGPSMTLSYKLFPGDGITKSKDPQKLYQARMDEIARAQQPNAIDHAIADRYQTSDPALHDAIVGQVQRGIAFLDSKAPKPTILQTMLPGDGTWKPSKAQLDEFGKYVHAVGDPASVLEDLAKGHVTLEGAETLRVVYPELFAEAQRMLMQSAPAMQKTLPYPTRVAISILYRVPVDNSMAPGHLQYLQAPTPGAQPTTPGGPPPGAPMPPAITGPLQLGKSTMTALDRRAGA